MTLITPVVHVTKPLDSNIHFSTSVDSFTMMGQVNHSTEVPQAWQLISGHTSGILQVWGDVSGILRPLLRIGRRDSPVTGLSICEDHGLICSSHLDGKIKVLPVPDPHGPGALPSMVGDKVVASVNPKFGELKASEYVACHRVLCFFFK